MRSEPDPFTRKDIERGRAVKSEMDLFKRGDMDKGRAVRSETDLFQRNVHLYNLHISRTLYLKLLKLIHNLKFLIKTSTQFAGKKILKFIFLNAFYI